MNKNIKRIIFILALLSLLVSMVLFYNTGIYLDESGASAEDLHGGKWGLALAWMRLLILFVLTLASGIALHNESFKESKLNNNRFAGGVKLLLDSLFVISILFLIGLPFMINGPLDIYRGYHLASGMYLIIILTDLAIMYVLYELRKIYKTIALGTPFTYDNAISLKRMSIASFSLAFVFVIKLFVFQTILTLIMLLVLIICGCFALTLSALFNEAARVKEENDLTI